MNQEINEGGKSQYSPANTLFIFMKFHIANNFWHDSIEVKSNTFSNLILIKERNIIYKQTCSSYLLIYTYSSLYNSNKFYQKNLN